MCCTVGDDGMDWGQAGEKRKQLRPLCYIWSTGIRLVWESRALCCGNTQAHMNVFRSTDTGLHAHLYTRSAERRNRKQMYQQSEQLDPSNRSNKPP